MEMDRQTVCWITLPKMSHGKHTETVICTEWITGEDGGTRALTPSSRRENDGVLF